MPKKEKLTIESAINRLEEIIKKMEQSELGLDKAFDLYKEGVELSAFCNTNLKAIEKDVMVLKEQSNGEFSEQLFQADKLEEME